jgi:hypothetical protein
VADDKNDRDQVQDRESQEITSMINSVSDSDVIRQTKDAHLISDDHKEVDIQPLHDEEPTEEPPTKQKDSRHITGETTEEAEEGDNHAINQRESAQVGNFKGDGQEKATGSNAVGRIRRAPVTRSDDFLWAENCMKHSRVNRN